MESHKKCSKPPTSYHLDVSKSEEKLKKIVGFISQNSPITNINHQHVLVYIVGISQWLWVILLVKGYPLYC